jgi:DNA-binding LacI/PurR family transcriptional regulator
MFIDHKSRVTMGEIAKRLNTTVSTVSRAINNPERISDEMRERVMDMVKELNYVPNSAARTLKTNKTGILGYLYNRETPFSEQITPMRIFESLEIEAQGCGYHMALASIPSNGLTAKLPLMVEERRVDGIFLGGKMDSSLIKKLKEIRVPLVLLGNYARDVESACVIQDDIGGAYSVIKHFIELGHRRIAFIGAPFDNLWSWERLQGMRLAMDEFNIEIKPQYLHSEDAWSGRNGFLSLMELDCAPTAIFCASDRLSRTVMETALERGISIPSDVSIAGFDDEPWSSVSVPRLTTVSIFPEVIAVAAIEKMTGMINGKSVISRVVTPTKLIVRESSAAVLNV